MNDGSDQSNHDNDNDLHDEMGAVVVAVTPFRRRLRSPLDSEKK